MIMADEESKFKTPKDLALSDYAHSLLRGVIGAIPVGGTLVNELLGFLVQPALKKRQEHWFSFIGHSLEDVLNRIDILEEITSNDNFINVAIKATRIALETTKFEKINALKNVVINTAIKINLDETKQHVFMALLDSFNEYHIVFLKLLNGKNAPNKNISFSNSDGSWLVNPNFYHLIMQLYPELNQSEEFCRLIMHDLYYKDLINTKDLNFPLMNLPSNPFAVGQRTTEIGNKFLNFISDPSFK
ncbi:MAG: hypothetical protein LBQ12_08810 [Deltaproteobacteria bacterium]|jgi:hypothetical protein|nr:hypothetical protein [Deltaproteobacteria bacterium]